MLLIIGGWVLLSTLAVSVHSVRLDDDRFALNAQAGMAAVSTVHGKAAQLAAAGFDSLAIGTAFTDSIFTPFAAFACTAWVDYVSSAAPDSAVVGPTTLKRIRVTAASPYLADTITADAIIGAF
jgi:hypothetical protein